jgi:hypothetical protein
VIGDAEKARHAAALERVPALVARLDGQIKYYPMLLDHPEWSDDECIALASIWDGVARERHAAGETDWNRGIPYARNIWKD